MFYKLIVDSIIQDKKLRIPKKFVKKYGHELSTIAILAVPGSCEWPVDIYRAGKKFWFSHGWDEFLDFHSIHAGYFLIFSYQGNSKFSVFLYNLESSGTKSSYMPPRSCTESNLEKQYSVACHESLNADDSVAVFNFQYWPPTLPGQNGSSKPKKYETLTPHSNPHKLQQNMQCTRNTGLRTELEESIVGKGLHSTYETRRTNKRKQRTVDVHESLLNEELGLKVSRRSRDVTTGERERVLRTSQMYTPANPFCRVVLPPSFQYLLHIPRSFATKHLCRYPLSVMLQLSDGKQWPVNCVNGGKGCAKLSKGWNKFALGNKLGEGDICIFELIKMKEIALKVNIFRVHEGAGPVYKF